MEAIIVIFLFGLSLVSAAFIDCPADWVTSQTGQVQSCYKFVFHPRLTYENATLYCIDKGAYLLSINNLEENSFINNWLQINDDARNMWYTSGSMLSGTSNFLWEGDNTNYGLDLGNQQHWAYDGRSGTGNRIMYKLDQGTTYGWSRTYGNKSIAFICEINQKDADRIISESRDYNYGSQDYDKTKVEYGPAFTLKPKDIVMIPNAVSVYMDCHAVGRPSPTYKWFKVDVDSTETEVNVDGEPRYTLTNGKFTIQNPQSSDLGVYRCEAQNKFGKIRTSFIQLSFASLGEFSNVENEPVSAFAYDGAVVECSRISYKPSVVYTWKRSLSDGDIITVYTDVTRHIFKSFNGKLYFSEIQEVDAGDYYCQVDLSGLSENTVGAAQPPSRTSNPIDVIVNDQAAKSDWGPIIQNDFIAVFPSPPLRGQDVQMECFAYGSAQNYETSWIYSWKKEGSNLSPRVKLQNFNRVLVIQNAQKEDEGTYTCSVTRGNTRSDSRSVTLVLSAKPYFLIPLKNQHIDKGATITWRCQAGGNPSPQYTWYKNGVVLTSGPDIQINRNLMIIKNADANNHNGMYQCGAKNDLGESFTSAQIRVLSFKPSFQKNPLPDGVDAAFRGNITIACNPEAAPSAAITWSKNNVKLNLQTGTMQSGSRIRKLPSGNLYITSIQRSDAGIYTCTATNQYGQDSSSCSLHVKESAVITIKPQRSQTVSVNETAIMTCEASYDPELDLVYLWKFNGKIIDIANDPHYAKSTSTPGLLIRTSQFQHAGTYECVARTTLNEVSDSGQLIVEGPPGEPLGVYGDDVTSTSIHLFWFPGSNRGEPVTHFVIEAESDFEPDQWNVVGQSIPEGQTKLSGNTRDERHFIVTSLDPGNGYRFRVQAINQLGFGDYSRPSSYYRTLSAPPSKAPDGLNGGGGSVGDLTMTWQKLPRRYHGDEGMTYTLYWRRYTQDTSRRWESKSKIDPDIEKYVTLVGEENYYLEYEVKIQARNPLGHGPNSTSVVVFSAEGMPIAAPLNVLADGYNSTALEISWTKVDDTRQIMKGRVRGYQINYWLREEDGELPYKRSIRYRGQRDSGLIIGLDSDSYYFAEVQVYNSAGLGPLGEKYPGETASFAPFLYPQEVYVTSHGSESVKIHWRGISTSTAEDTLKGYKVFLWEANDNFRLAEEFESEKHPTELILTGLKKDIVYAARVAGYSGGGDGKKSPTIYFTLGGVVQLDPSVTEIRASASYIVHSLLCIIVSLLVHIYML